MVLTRLFLHDINKINISKLKYLIRKGRPIYYSFKFMLIIPTGLIGNGRNAYIDDYALPRFESIWLVNALGKVFS